MLHSVLNWWAGICLPAPPIDLAQPFVPLSGIIIYFGGIVWAVVSPIYVGLALARKAASAISKRFSPKKGEA